MDKEEIREMIWDGLESTGEARFPYPPHGRIPNFAGAKRAAEKLSSLDKWIDASSIKSNPDSPQRPVRRIALSEDKTVYMAVPRLGEENCFIELDPDEIDDLDEASTIKGSSVHGDQIHPSDMMEVDMVVSGCVAVNREGDRIGKGEGYSDIEFGVLGELDLVREDTVTATTVHPIQVMDTEVPVKRHDTPMDVIVSPEEIIRESNRPKPSGIYWENLSEEKISEIPILQELRNQRY